MIGYITFVDISEQYPALGAYHVYSGQEKVYGRVFYLDHAQSQHDAWLGCVNFCEREGITLVPSRCRRT